MKNIYDIRQNEKLVYILQEDYSPYFPTIELLSSIAVGVNLYYEDTAEKYFNILSRIPENITIYIISSNQKILDLADNYFKDRQNVILLEKDNRGRDISALLVVFREIALKYQYICFVHDKKARYSYLQQDTNIWIENLWGNSIESQEYIFNVLHIFAKHSEVGLLVPPEPIGDHLFARLKNVWGANYQHVKNLVEELQVNCNLDLGKPPITLGTVFWARTCALEKILRKNWKYQDFPVEPLPEDGTISHAIERILGYVAQDAGFKTATIMSNTYAELELLFCFENMKQMFSVIDDELHIHSMHQLKYRQEQIEMIVDFFSRYRRIYLYGAGKYGRELLMLIQKQGLEPQGFVVSDGYKSSPDVEGLPVYEMHEIKPSQDVGIIIAVNYNLQEEVEGILKQHGYSNYVLGYI